MQGVNFSHPFEQDYKVSIILNKDKQNGKIILTDINSEITEIAIEKLHVEDRVRAPKFLGKILSCSITDDQGLIYRVLISTNDFDNLNISIQNVYKKFLAKNIVYRSMSNVINMKTSNVLGVNSNEIFQIHQYLEVNKVDLDKLSEPLFISREANGLPRSLIVVPSGPRKGTYALAKTHGNVKEIGIGSSNRVTLMVNIDTGEKKVFRNCKSLLSTEREIQINKDLASRPDMFVTGDVVKYVGPWRSRLGTADQQRSLNQPKDFIPREKDVNKVGFILDYIEGGVLYDRLVNLPEFPIDEALRFGEKYANQIAVLNDEFGYVHLDQKPENILLTQQGRPRVADFDFTSKIGTEVTTPGSPGYYSPEVLEAILNRDNGFEAKASSDAWGLGLILLSLVGGLGEWQFRSGQNSELDFFNILYELKSIKQHTFDNVQRLRPEAVPLLGIIDECLQLSPEARLTARQVADKLTALLN